MVALTTAGLVSASMSGQAAPPPRNYPINEIKSYAATPIGGIPIRRGFYDAVVNKGFGYDKVRWRHNIWNL